MNRNTCMALLCLLLSYATAAQTTEVADRGKYIIEDSVLIRTDDNALLSAVVVRKKNAAATQPAALMFFMYSNLEQSIREAISAADHGYTGIVADVRGKRLSPDTPAPYEHEVRDVNAVISWIARQPWSDGRVAMYGGSYSGFAQWAATKNLHPALKTIVPYVAAIPGLGLPMENNIFLNANYQWPFYVTNNKYLDDEANQDRKRIRNLFFNWFYSGAAYERIDSVDQRPNPWLQRWLQHPDYDAYWQAMVPYREDFRHINIPVLTITGYYDDGQISALHYLREHYKYRPDAEHYLVIGPYDHFGAQKGGNPVLRGYTVDSVALINTRELTFAWMDYVLKKGKKPALLQDKVNYEIMGANTWAHAASIPAMSDTNFRLYLGNGKNGNKYPLLTKALVPAASLYQQVDLADRNTFSNDYYPDPIIGKQPNPEDGLYFISDTFSRPVAVSGLFSGTLKVTINKKDMDIGVVLYELLPDSSLFALSYFLGRASYAADMSTRRLLHPGQEESISFDRSRLVSKKLGKGSRLMLVLNINKNPFAEINYGSGGTVSKETIRDAATPLKINWSTDSFIDIPVEYLER